MMILDRNEVLRMLRRVDRWTRQHQNMTRTRRDGMAISSAIALVRDGRGYRGALNFPRAVIVPQTTWGQVVAWLSELERRNRAQMSKSDRMALYAMRMFVQAAFDPGYWEEPDYSGMM